MQRHQKKALPKPANWQGNRRVVNRAEEVLVKTNTVNESANRLLELVSVFRV